MEAEANNFAANKRRRRSSLFVDRQNATRIFDDIDDSQGATKNEPTVSSSNVNAGEIQNYISNTKQCHRNWRSYKREVKSKLEAAKNAKPLQFDEKTLLEFLNVEDRSFLKEAKDFLEKRSELTKEAASVTSRLEALVDQYDFNKKLLDVVFGDLPTLHETTVAKAVEDHEDMVRRKFGRLLNSSEFPVSSETPQILMYNSDSESDTD